VSRCQKRTSDFMVQGKINRGRHIDHPAGHHPDQPVPTSAIPLSFTGQMPFLPPNQQCQSTEGNYRIRIREKTLEFSSTVLPAPSPYLHATNQQRQITEQNSTHGLPSTKDNYSLDLILSSLTPDGQLPLPQC